MWVQSQNYTERRLKNGFTGTTLPGRYKQVPNIPNSIDRFYFAERTHWQGTGRKFYLFQDAVLYHAGANDYEHAAEGKARKDGVDASKEDGSYNAEEHEGSRQVEKFRLEELGCTPLRGKQLLANASHNTWRNTWCPLTHAR